MTIRRAQPEDNPAARALVFAELRALGVEPEPQGLDADALTFGLLPEVDHWIAALDDRLVGTIALTPDPEDRSIAWLSKFYVETPLQGSGIGRLLYGALIERAHQLGVNLLKLQTRTRFERACRFYEAAGWRRGPDRSCDGGCDRLYLLKLDGRSMAL